MPTPGLVSHEAQWQKYRNYVEGSLSFTILNQVTPFDHHFYKV